ncbi:hypothetical protein [Nonomuraea sp. NPDC059022]|uniref:hypothetical protein n=1 Tax=Nonomuraea sp. NPDC059022 TaxID=3346705 RepID=UPI0036BC6872
MVAVALAGPWLAPADPNAGDLGAALTGPSPAHPLGADAAGRDTLSRLIAGASTTLLGPIAVVLFSTVAGVLAGVTAGWVGGGPPPPRGPAPPHQHPRPPPPGGDGVRDP